MPKTSRQSRREFLQRTGPGVAASIAAVHSSTSAQAQTPSPVKEATVYNRPVVLVANDKLEVAVAPQGGSMLRILIQGDPQGLSPFGNPEMVPQVPDRRKLQGPMVGRQRPQVHSLG